MAQFGHSHTQFEAAFTKAMRRAATTSEAGAFAAFRILRALADTTSSYTGESAARLVDVVGDVLVQALSVTFPLRQITVPAYYRNDAARAATYVTEETDKARKEAKDAAAVTLTAALSALAVPGATTARCLARRRRCPRRGRPAASSPCPLRWHRFSAAPGATCSSRRRSRPSRRSRPRRPRQRRRPGR